MIEFIVGTVLLVFSLGLWVFIRTSWYHLNNSAKEA